jgi:hypothetical protein
MGCGSGFGGLLPCAWCALLSRCEDYRLACGRVEDALRAPLRGRAAPQPAVSLLQ